MGEFIPPLNEAEFENTTNPPLYGSIYLSGPQPRADKWILITFQRARSA